MDESRTQDTREEYVGPSAARIANLLPHRVSLHNGWFWTSTAVCHGGKSDGLAFRQRPDGNGIDVRCHTRGCGRGVIVTELEALTGLPIWTAYEPVRDAGVEAEVKKPWWKRKKVVVAGVVALVVAAPLLTLDLELFFLNLFGLGIGWLLLRRFMPRRSARRFRRRRLRALTTHHNTQGSLSPRAAPTSLPESGRNGFKATHRHVGGAR